jgi:phosphoribosylformylglycinamidine synthase
MVDDVRQTCTMDLKAPGNLLYLVGDTRKELGGSYYYRMRDGQGGAPPAMAPSGRAVARALHQAISSGLVSACHDCSEGGVAVALAEMALAGRLGAALSLNALPLDGDEAPADDWLLFSESNGRYLIEIAPEKVQAFEALLDDAPAAQVGQVLSEPRVAVSSSQGGAELFALSVVQIEDAWRGHLNGWEGRHE